MEKKEMVSKACNQIVNSDNFIVLAVSGNLVDNTIFLDNAGSAMAIIAGMRKIENAILFPQNSPQPSKIIG